jgi:hypothetical protein
MVVPTFKCLREGTRKAKRQRSGHNGLGHSDQVLARTRSEFRRMSSDIDRRQHARFHQEPCSRIEGHTHRGTCPVLSTLDEDGGAWRTRITIATPLDHPEACWMARVDQQVVRDAQASG